MSRPGELMIVGFEGRAAPSELIERVRAGRVGGVILFARNIDPEGPASVARLVAEIARATPPGPPLIVSIDQEGGRVQRLKEPFARWPPMGRVVQRAAASESSVQSSAEILERVGHALGGELGRVGFNVDWAPVLDVHTNPENPVIGDRAFGVTPDEVAVHALAFWRGLERAGVRGCGKHFPGHGETAQDSHLELPRLDLSLARLRAVELAPFAAAVRAGIGMIMTAHVVVSALDDRPATMSRAWIDGVLRGELGFGGVVVSDDLDMQAVAAHYPVEQVVREALAAGVDAFLACRDPERQARAEAELERCAVDPVLAARVAESRARVRHLRATLTPPLPDAALAAPWLPDEEAAALARSLA